MHLSGFKVSEQIGGGGADGLWRARRVRDGRRVLLRTSVHGSSNSDLGRLLERELEICRDLDVDGVLAALDLVADGPGAVLVLADAPGASLERCLGRLGEPLTLSVALRIGADLAGILSTLHRRDLVHRDLRPANVIYDAESGEVNLSGLGRASRVPRETWRIRAPDQLEGDAAYLAPEATGRLNRQLDYRADLYALGVMLFEMLTGRLPFDELDRVGLVHAHIAREPPDACELRPELPAVVSAIASRLLAKAAEDRYQSSLGLVHDLERCLSDLEDGGEVGARRFVLGGHDVPERFELPQKLYGREAEIRWLEEALDAAAGHRRVRLVAGYSGVGKTSLIEELRFSVLRQRGLFASGTFDRRSSATPHEGVLTVLRDLISQQLGAPPDRVAAWARQLVDDLGVNLGIMTEALPALRPLVGEPPPMPEVPPENARIRFLGCVERFLATFADASLVLFLDDLQWIDSASLELLESLLTGDGPAFLLLGAYRDNEVDEDHVLSRAVTELSARGVDVDTLRLSPLGEPALARLITEALQAQPAAGGSATTSIGNRIEAPHADVAPLAELVYRKTAGNPFFARTFLRTLYQHRLLRFESPAAASGGRPRWTWDLDAIASLEAAESVIELVARRLTELPPPARRILAVASVLGKEIDVETLAMTCDGEVGPTEERLIEACREGLLLKVGARYAFVHDRVREGAYELLDEEERAGVHLRIGRILHHRSTGGDGADRASAAERSVFEIADHLNRAAHLLGRAPERRQLAQLNAEAGRRARASGAFPAAYAYLKAGLVHLQAEATLLGTDLWQDAYELASTLHAEAAEAAFLARNHAAAEQLSGVLLENARDLLDAMPAYETRISMHSSRHEEDKALRIALEVLEHFGVEMPFEPTASDLRPALLSADRAAETALARVREQGLQALSLPGDPASPAVARLLMLAALIAGWARWRLMRLAMCRLVELATTRDVGGVAPIAFIFMAELRFGELEDFTGGRRAGELGLELAEQSPASGLAPSGRVLFDLIIGGRTLHPRELIGRCTENYRRALESGDLMLAATSGFQISVALLLEGRELDKAEPSIRVYQGRTRGFGNLLFACSIEILAELVAVLRGRGTVEAAIDISNVLPEAAVSVRTRVIGPEMMIRFLLGQRDEALETARESLTMPIGMVPLFPLDFYRCLIFLDSAPEEPELAACRARLEAQAEATPELHGHKRDLVTARAHQAAGRTDEALALYEQAAAGARSNGFPHEAALANELAGELCLAPPQGSGLSSARRHRAATGFLRDAVAAYRDWGARAKLDQLYEQHPDLMATPAEAFASLDVASLEQAESLLQTELDLSRLLRRLIALLMQNVGAQRGFLLRGDGPDGARPGSWDRIVIEASGSVDRDRVQLQEGKTLDAEAEIAATVVRFVARTQETVTLAEANRDSRFASDPYIESRRPRSILCFPLVHRGRILQIVYLENDRSPDVFSQQRSTAVRLLASQAAAALENARLHHSLKQEVEIRRRAEADLAVLKDRLKAENVYLQEEIRSHFEEIVGDSEAMRKVLHKVEQVAATDATVLIQGETGTGKELIARALHRLSPRRERPLVSVNCAALPATLIESELFGHEKGAFTGAASRKAGRFELAHSGTLFLDEIGDLPLELQAKLLRVLQEGEFERLGGNRTLSVDVRIIAATHRDLQQAIGEGSFRSDLYYRLTVFPIELPPLRERAGDVPLLAQYFVGRKRAKLGSRVCKIPQPTMEQLVAYPWPGNVRELENVIERALILSRGETLRLDESFGRARPEYREQEPAPIAPPVEAPPVEESSGGGTLALGSPEHLAELERARIRGALEACGWKIKGKGNAAERLGFKPSTLRDRMKKLGIVRPS